MEHRTFEYYAKKLKSISISEEESEETKDFTEEDFYAQFDKALDESIQKMIDKRKEDDERKEEVPQVVELYKAIKVILGIFPNVVLYGRCKQRMGEDEDLLDDEKWNNFSLICSRDYQTQKWIDKKGNKEAHERISMLNIDFAASILAKMAKETDEDVACLVVQLASVILLSEFLNHDRNLKKELESNNKFAKSVATLAGILFGMEE